MSRGDRIINGYGQDDAFDIPDGLRQKSIGHALVWLAVALANFA